MNFKKQNFLSFAETSFFKVLEQATDNKYYIFPQVNLASLVRPNAKGRDWWTYFRKISQKSVDYVLADKKTCNPVLILELDDSSHNEIDRQLRDGFVDEVLEAAELSILHVNFRSGYNVMQLQNDIKSKLTGSKLEGKVEK